MSMVSSILIAFIALQHIGFLVLEMFLWTKPIGLKIFKLDPGFAEQSAALAANQGLYNGFLAAGLIWSLLPVHTHSTFGLKLFFLACVLIAGLYGAATVSRTILFVQALPAVFAMAILFMSKGS